MRNLGDSHDSKLSSARILLFSRCGEEIVAARILGWAAYVVRAGIRKRGKMQENSLQKHSLAKLLKAYTRRTVIFDFSMPKSTLVPAWPQQLQLDTPRRVEQADNG
jgi:hypothetical protein